MDELPEDIIVIIFSNLDVKTLLSLRFTCRQWHQIISGSCFGRQLAEKQNLKKGIVQQPMLLIFYHNPSSSDDDHHHILNPNPNPNNKDERILEIDLNLFRWPNWHSNNNKDPLLFQCCANGIFCFTRKSSCIKPYLVNPLRKEVLELPPLNRESFAGLRFRYFYGLGFDKLKRTYKIICAVLDLCESNFGEYWIIISFYTLKDSNWIQLITKLSLQPHRYVPMGYPTWIDKEGVFYWVCFDPNTNSTHNNNCYMVMASHIEKEEFRWISLPLKANCDYFFGVNIKLVDLNYGVLSLVHYTSSNNIKIWNLIKDDEEEIWVQKYKIKIRTTLIQDSWPYMPNYHNPKHSYVHMKSWDSYSHHPYEVIGPWENDEVLIRYLTGTFMAYNLNTKTFKKLNLPPIDSNCFAYSYFPNLVSVSWIQDQQLLGI
ncbi:hypothetical protein CsatB_015422 [Cannabis sativa]